MVGGLFGFCFQIRLVPLQLFSREARDGGGVSKPILCRGWVLRAEKEVG